ncbi:MAG: metallophosphoesterase [Myxococcaceae bacterium]
MPRPNLKTLFRRPPLVAGGVPASKKPSRVRPPTLCSHDAVSPRIATALDGVRLGQISDIHVRTGVKPRRLHMAVEMMNALKPDFVVLTGDYVCMTARPVKLLTEALRELKVPAYATLGNHDHWSDAAKVRDALAMAGVDVLTNEHRVLQLRGSQLHLVGVDDSVTKHDDPEAAFKGVPEDATRIVLSHDPKSADRLHAYKPALILSGHTHGGQVFVKKVTPYLSARVGIKYLAGFFEIEGSLLYVTRGLGASVPVRFRAPHEIALLTLRSGALSTNAVDEAAA